MVIDNLKILLEWLEAEYLRLTEEWMETDASLRRRDELKGEAKQCRETIKRIKCMQGKT